MRKAKTFDNGGFADAGLADQHRIIFGAPRQHLDHPANFIVAADDRIELSFAREIGEIAAIFFQSLVFFFGVGIGNSLRAANADQGVENLIAGGAVFFEKLARFAAVLHHRQQQMLGGNIFVF